MLLNVILKILNDLATIQKPKDNKPPAEGVVYTFLDKKGDFIRGIGWGKPLIHHLEKNLKVNSCYIIQSAILAPSDKKHSWSVVDFEFTLQTDTKVKMIRHFILNKALTRRIFFYSFYHALQWKTFLNYHHLVTPNLLISKHHFKMSISHQLVNSFLIQFF